MVEKRQICIGLSIIAAILFVLGFILIISGEFLIGAGFIYFVLSVSMFGIAIASIVWTIQVHCCPTQGSIPPPPPSQGSYPVPVAATSGSGNIETQFTTNVAPHPHQYPSGIAPPASNYPSHPSTYSGANPPSYKDCVTDNAS